MSIEEAWVGGAALADRLASQPLHWLRGGWCGGKSTALSQIAETLRPQPGWLPLLLDLADHRQPNSLARRPLQAIAAVDPGAESLATPPHLWMAWLDSGPGAAERDALDAASRLRWGLGLADARRRLGPDELLPLLQGHVARLGLDEPRLPAAELLAALWDHCLAPAGLRPVVLLDNADAADLSDTAETLDALARELPAAYGQDWCLVVTSRLPPPAPLQNHVRVHELPGRDDPTWPELGPLLANYIAELPTAAVQEIHAQLLFDTLAVSGGPVELLWDNVPYRGTVVVTGELSQSWSEWLPPDTAFQLVLLTRPLPLPDAWPVDPRVVIVQPAPLDGAERGRLLRGLALESAARGSDRDLDPGTAMVQWLATRPMAGPEWLRAWVDGTAVAHPGLAAPWSSLVRDVPVHLWAAAVFRSRLAAVHAQRNLWIEAPDLELPLSTEALRVFERALGGIDGAEPWLRGATHLTVDGEPAGFGWLRSRLARQGGALAVPELLVELCAPPFGLTPELVRLYLFAFVVRSEPPVHLETVDAAGDVHRLDRRELRSREWVTVPLAQVRRLLRSDQRAWDELRPFAAVLLPDLPAEGPPSSRTRAALRAALVGLRESVTWVERQIGWLARELGAALPAETAETLRRLARVATADSSESFGLRLDELYGFNQAAWQAACGRLERWRRLADEAERIAAFVAWLASVRLPPQHVLEGDLLALRAQFDLARLLSQPHLLRGLLAQGEQFQRQFAAAYREAHGGHHAEAARLAGQVSELRTARAALARLNELTQLGAPVLAGAGLEAIEALLAVCRHEPEPRHEPLCAHCRWTLDTELPIADVEELRREIATAFAARSRRLRELLTAEMVAQAGDNRLAALHQVLALQQSAALPEVLTPETVELLRACLPGEPAGVLAELRATHPRLDASGVEQVVATLRALLERATADGRSVEL